MAETIPTRCDGCAFSAVYPEDPLAPARGITVGAALSLLVWLGVAAVIYFGWRA